MSSWNIWLFHIFTKTYPRYSDHKYGEIQMKVMFWMASASRSNIYKSSYNGYGYTTHLLKTFTNNEIMTKEDEEYGVLKHCGSTHCAKKRKNIFFGKKEICFNLTLSLWIAF